MAKGQQKRVGQFLGKDTTTKKLGGKHGYTVTRVFGWKKKKLVGQREVAPKTSSWE